MQEIEKLIENVKEWRDHYRDNEQVNGVVITLDRVISALEAPRPFDVLQHLRDGELEYLGASGGWHKVEPHFLIGDIMNEELRPRTPKAPTAEELIEDARILLMDLTVPNGIEPVMTPIIDLLEKLTLEQEDK